MKKILFAVLLIMAMSLTACDWNSLDAKVAAVRAAEPFVNTGVQTAYTILSGLHAVGKLPENFWAITQTAYTKYTALHNQFGPACEEWDSVKGKPAGQVILQLVTDMNKIVAMINGILTDWNAGNGKIDNQLKPILDSLPADLKEYLKT